MRTAEEGTLRIDGYVLRARLVPILLAALPGALAAVALFPEAGTAWKGLSGLLVGTGLPALLAQLGRDHGKRKETYLFRAWGGAPSIRLLRHGDCGNSLVLRRRHRELEQLMPDLQVPNAEEEARDPDAADTVYEACVLFLRAATRDKRRFGLLYEENVSYGFRRNLWGMKPLGVWVTLFSIAAIMTYLILTYKAGRGFAPMAAFAGLAEVMLLGAWIGVITPGWVKLAADAYADRLLEACDQL